jgi:hypothetical protein
VGIGGLPAGEHLGVEVHQVAAGRVLQSVSEHALPLGERVVAARHDEVAAVTGDGQFGLGDLEVEDGVALVGLDPGGDPVEVARIDRDRPDLGLFADLHAGRGEGVPVCGEGVDVDAVALEADAVDDRQGVVGADVRAGLLDDPLKPVGVDRGHRVLRGMLVSDPADFTSAGVLRFAGRPYLSGRAAGSSGRRLGLGGWCRDVAGVGDGDGRSEAERHPQGADVDRCGRLVCGVAGVADHRRDGDPVVVRFRRLVRGELGGEALGFGDPLVAFHPHLGGGLFGFPAELLLLLQGVVGRDDVVHEDGEEVVCGELPVEQLAVLVAELVDLVDGAPAAAALQAGDQVC